MIDGKARRPGGDDLRVVVGNRGGTHHNLRAVDVGRRVANGHRRTGLPQLRDGCAVRAIRPRNGETTTQQCVGKATHAHAADA